MTNTLRTLFLTANIICTAANLNAATFASKATETTEIIMAGEPRAIAHKELSFDTMRDILTDLNQHIAAGNLPETHVYVFDIHGVLTSCANPETQGFSLEYPRLGIINFVQNLRDKGATVVLSSAWNEPTRICESLRIAGFSVDIADEPTIENEIFFGKPYTVMRLSHSASAGPIDRSTRSTSSSSIATTAPLHIISAMEISLPDTSATEVRDTEISDTKITDPFYRAKAIAGMIAANDQGIAVSHLYLFDDAPHNLECFSHDVSAINAQMDPAQQFYATAVFAAPLNHLTFRTSAQVSVDLRPYLPEGSSVRFYINDVCGATLPRSAFAASQRISINDHIPFSGNEIDFVRVSYEIIGTDLQPLTKRLLCNSDRSPTGLSTFVITKEGQPHSLEALRFDALPPYHTITTDAVKPIRINLIGNKYVSLTQAQKGQVSMPFEGYYTAERSYILAPLGSPFHNKELLDAVLSMSAAREEESFGGYSASYISYDNEEAESHGVYVFGEYTRRLRVNHGISPAFITMHTPEIVAMLRHYGIIQATEMETLAAYFGCDAKRTA